MFDVVDGLEELSLEPAKKKQGFTAEELELLGTRKGGCHVLSKSSNYDTGRSQRTREQYAKRQKRLNRKMKSPSLPNVSPKDL